MAQEAKDGPDGEGLGPIEAAARRLERAVALLEGQIKSLSDRADGAVGGLFDLDRSQLAEELDTARARERELHAAGADASQALAQAIDGIRSALARSEVN